MKLTKQELQQLKELLPDVSSQFPSESEALKEAVLSVPTTQVFIESTLTLLLKAHEERVKEKYELIHAHILQGTGKYKTRYTLPRKLLKEKVKVAQEKALKQHREALEATKQAALDELIGDAIAAKEEAEALKKEQEKDALKTQLLSKLFG
tara:strand:+ start:474 stop:926 length:453 start_codon:yes stop_codon:yes gene_type:complete